jgi:hypothetical protein
MRKLFAILLLLLFPLFVFGQDPKATVSIDLQNRVENISPGYCSWACIETLGRHHKVEMLYNLMKKRSEEFTWERKNGKLVKSDFVPVRDGRGNEFWVKKNVGHAWAIYRRLQEQKVKFYVQPTGEFSSSLINYAMKNKLGCMVNMGSNAFYRGSTTHSIILTDFGDDHIRYVDPNYPGYNYSHTKEWFSDYWTGYVLVVAGLQ